MTNAPAYGGGKKGAHTTEVGSCMYYTRLKMLANDKCSSLMCAKKGAHTTEVGSPKYYTRPKMLATTNAPA
jgi:hypothetical protein